MNPFDFLSASAGNFELEKALRFLAAQQGFPLVGNVYLVMNSTDKNYVDIFKGQKEYSDGTAMIQPTVLAANAVTMSNRNDVIFLSANATSNKVASMLTVSNNRVHFVGLDPNGRKIGSRAMISNTGAGVATDVAMVYVTGTGCSFHNISFKNNWTVTENLFAVKDHGIQTYFENCDIENLGSAHLTNADAASLNLGGNECIYKNCTLGQDTLLVTSTAGQQVLVTNRGTTATKCTRSRFDKCRFQSYTNDTTHVFVRFGAYSIDRSVTFEEPEFDNALAPTSAVTLAVAVMAPATVAGGINIAYPRAFGVTNIATAAVGNTGVLLVAPVNSTSDATGIAST
jgi:hypothetical protein